MISNDDLTQGVKIKETTIKPTKIIKLDGTNKIYIKYLLHNTF